MLWDSFATSYSSLPIPEPHAVCTRLAKRVRNIFINILQEHFLL